MWSKLPFDLASGKLRQACPHKPISRSPIGGSLLWTTEPVGARLNGGPTLLQERPAWIRVHSRPFAVHFRNATLRSGIEGVGSYWVERRTPFRRLALPITRSADPPR